MAALFAQRAPEYAALTARLAVFSGGGMKAFARQLMQAWLSQIVTHLDAVAVVPCVICQFEAYGQHRNYQLARRETGEA